MPASGPGAPFSAVARHVDFAPQFGPNLNIRLRHTRLRSWSLRQGSPGVWDAGLLLRSIIRITRLHIVEKR